MFDVIVVGAGPGGSIAARECASAGLKTLLLEKEKLPRSKLCGGGVTPKVLPFIGSASKDAIFQRAVRTARICIKDEKFEFVSPEILVFMTSRLVFDHHLTCQAMDSGAEVLDSTIVRRVAVTDNCVSVLSDRGSFQAKLVIGADGVNSIVARTAGLRDHWAGSSVAFCLESEAFVGEGAVEDFMGSSDAFELYFGISPQGYAWVFPKGDHLTIGIGCQLSEARELKILFREFVRRLKHVEPDAVPRPEAHLLPIGGLAKTAVHRDRIMLVGDAAGLAEPLLGEGIYYAARSGHLAARRAIECCLTGDFSERSLAEYQRGCAALFDDEFAIAYKFAQLIYMEDLERERAMRFFLRQPKVQKCITGLMTGAVNYRKTRQELFWLYLAYRISRTFKLPFCP